MEILQVKTVSVQPLYCKPKYIPGIISSACWQRHARNPPLRPTACCEPDSAGSQHMDPGHNHTDSLKISPLSSAC